MRGSFGLFFDFSDKGKPVAQGQNDFLYALIGLHMVVESTDAERLLVVVVG